MSQPRWSYDESWRTPHDLRSSLYCFVKLLSGNLVVVCDTSGEQPIGVLQSQPRSGEIAQVRVMGRTKIQGAATIECGRYAKTNHSGMAINVVSGDWQGAWAQERAHAGADTAFMVCIAHRKRL